MLIECSNIKKSFQGIDLLTDISFKVDDHDKLRLSVSMGRVKQLS